MRSAVHLRDPLGGDDESDDALSAVDMALLLPDELPDAERSALPLGVRDKYLRLRLAQADDALVSLKRNLRRGTTLRQHQEEHVAGTGVAANTRMQTAIKNQSHRQELDAGRYRAARAALRVLDPDGAWKHRLLELKETDIRPPLREQDASEGRRELTWIWRVRRVAGASNTEGDPDVAEPAGDEDDSGEYIGHVANTIDLRVADLRVEWAKSLARAERWEEEVILLKAEMVRTLLFLDHKAARWRFWASNRTDVRDDVRAGLLAYAEKQVHINTELARKFASRWVGLFKEYTEGLPSTWPSAYQDLPYVVRNIKDRRTRTRAYQRLQAQNAMDVDVA